MCDDFCISSVFTDKIREYMMRETDEPSPERAVAETSSAKKVSTWLNQDVQGTREKEGVTPIILRGCLPLAGATRPELAEQADDAVVTTTFQEPSTVVYIFESPQDADRWRGKIRLSDSNSRIKSINRMQIMEDGSECDKSASVEEEAARAATPKASLLSEALLTVKDKSKSVAAPTSNGLSHHEDEKPDAAAEEKTESPEEENGEDAGPLVNGVHEKSEESKEEAVAEAEPPAEEPEDPEEAMQVEEAEPELDEAEAEPMAKETPPPPPPADEDVEEEAGVDAAAPGEVDAEVDAKKSPVEAASIQDVAKEEKEDATPMSDDEDANSVASCASQSNQVNEVDTGSGSGSGSGCERFKERKRRLEKGGSSHGSDSDSALGAPQYKKRMERIEDSVGVEEDAREKLVREYLEQSAGSLEDMNQSADKLQREISALGELARAKELEWNSILRLRKLKEEMLERLLRKRRQYFITSSPASDWDSTPVPASAPTTPNPTAPLANSPASIPNDKDARKMKRPMMGSMQTKQSNPADSVNNNAMMVPIVSSSPSQVPLQVNGDRSSVRSSSNPSSNCININNKLQRPILPKPPQISASALLDLQNSVIGEGRQGPILDVKSIIADYRSRHPETIPRRGRRPTGGPAGPMQPKVESSIVSSTRFSGSPALMSMANLALGSGSHVRTVASSQDFPNNFMGHDISRPSSADSMKNSEPNAANVQSSNNVSFKDFLVHFAKMKQDNLSSQGGSPQVNSNKPSSQPPPYPEVTLHPVAAPPSPPQTQTSLLHGILTKSNNQSKSNANSQHRPTAFSPTLARLLTAPEKNSRNMRFQEAAAAPQFRPPVASNKNYTINDIFTPNKKSRNEITITPVSTIQKSKDEVVLLDDEEDASDRLVIDEGAAEPVAEVPECQGCHQRSAQFVCAGCGNQWYCSRECQVEAWEEHSEMCSEH
ncbi:uncharacterized protein [Bemisia tabaci]|uniref:uncharacterized protein isoform X2 n=1 Tax=Bemisia tabaci TaxID=7038 RepID=UPI003B28A9D4